MTYSVKDNVAVRSENAIGPNVASLAQSGTLKIFVVQHNSILVPHLLTGDLTQDEVIPF